MKHFISLRLSSNTCLQQNETEGHLIFLPKYQKLFFLFQQTAFFKNNAQCTQTNTLSLVACLSVSSGVIQEVSFSQRQCFGCVD